MKSSGVVVKSLREAEKLGSYSAGLTNLLPTVAIFAEKGGITNKKLQLIMVSRRFLAESHEPVSPGYEVALPSGSQKFRTIIKFR